MNIPLFQIDAFTNQLFGGNPAAVCPLKKWLPDDVLLNIARENNLAETAFFVPIDDHRFHLRWFTPEIEMDLCGHATLAAAFVLFEDLGHEREEILFETQSGLLRVKKVGGYLELDFPTRPPVQAELPPTISQSLNIQPVEVWKARDYLLLYEHEDDIRDIRPDIAVMNQINIDPGGVIVTAKGQEVDFVSRFFTPQASIFEDPVTGSAHCTLMPFWAARLDKAILQTRQLSPRGGELFCELLHDRVFIRGQAVEYFRGLITLDYGGA